MKVVLAGNPNAGKTTLFNALTKSSLRTGNFHGVTTAPARKTVKGITYSDVPGAYSFRTYSMEEQSALDEIKSADIIVNVVDLLTLENSLNFTRGIISACGRRRVIIFLTKSRALKRRGGWVDEKKLSEMLGVKVVSDEKILKKLLISPLTDTPLKTVSLSQAYSSGNLRISKADKLFYNRFFALFFFIFSITLTFFLAFHPSMAGAVLKNYAEKLICEDLSAVITSKMQNQAVISLLKDGILGGAGGILSFIPQLLILYLCLTLLDESGITSALSFATDGLFERVKLSGRAAFSLISGFGCTTAAILTTRGYSGGDAQKRTVAVLPFIPCGAKMPVFLTFLSPLFQNPFPAITCFYFAGVAATLIASLLIKGEAENMLSEIAPVTLPSFKAVVNKLFFYIKGFIIKVTGTVTLFCIVSWVMSHFSFTFEFVEPDESMLGAVSKALLPVFLPMGITDWRLAYAILSGFIAKENVAATIALLMPQGAGLSLSAALSACAFITFCPACVSAFSASCKEVGLKYTAKCFLFQLLTAFALSYAVRLIFLLIL